MLITENDERDWRAFSAAWPERMVRAADVAFAEYVHGQRSKRDFERIRCEADRACREDIEPITPDHIPPWFRKRLVRVLGPKGFKNMAFDSEWFVNAGTSRMWLPCIAKNGPYCYQEALRFAQVFVVEPIRPWYLDRQKAEELAAAAARKSWGVRVDAPTASFSDPREVAGRHSDRFDGVRRSSEVTNAKVLEHIATSRAAFDKIVLKLIGQPRALAAALRCRLELRRSAYSGWKYIRLAFVPYHIDEQPTQVEISHEFRIH